MRPLYESNIDRMNQRAVLDFVADAWKCSYVEAKPQCAWDAIFYNNKGKPRAVVEVKCRNNKKHAYPTYYLSCRKIQDCIAKAKTMNVEFVLLVRWADVLNYILPFRNPARLEHKRGRTDRHDKLDIEDVYHYDLNHFEPIVVGAVGNQSNLL